MIILDRLFRFINERRARQRRQQDALCEQYQINRCFSCTTLPFIVGLESVGTDDESISIMCVNAACKDPASTVTSLVRKLRDAVNDWNRINPRTDGAELFPASAFGSFNAFIKARSSRAEFRPTRAVDEGFRSTLNTGTRNQFSD